MSEEISEKEQKNTESYLDADNKKETVLLREEVKAVIQSEFSGPIPPPDIIEKYEHILPGSADRIIAMAEKQSIHRQNMERTMVESEARDSLLGIVFAFMLGIGCIIAAIVVVVLVPKNSGAVAGAVMGATGIGSITSGFIRSTRTKSK